MTFALGNVERDVVQSEHTRKAFGDGVETDGWERRGSRVTAGHSGRRAIGQSGRHASDHGTAGQSGNRAIGQSGTSQKRPKTKAKAKTKTWNGRAVGTTCHRIRFQASYRPRILRRNMSLNRYTPLSFAMRLHSQRFPDYQAVPRFRFRFRFRFRPFPKSPTARLPVCPAVVSSAGT